MPHIILPVAPISRKILLHDHQQDPVTPSHTDVLYHQLCYSRSPHIQWSSYFKLLSSQINVVLPARFSMRDRKQLHQAGYLLYISHLERMLHWVEAQTLVTANAWGAIEAFYEMHDIDEDDFSLESAYKRWQRYQDGLHYNVRDEVTRFDRHKAWHASVPFTREMCDDMAALIITTMHNDMYSYGDCYDIKLANAIKVWALKEYGKMSGPDIAALIKMPWRTVYNWIKRVDDWVSVSGLQHRMDRMAESIRLAA